MRTLGAHVDGGLSERIAVRVSSLHPANDLPADLAALAEPLSIGIHSVSRLSPAAGDKIVVFGAGPIGQAIVLALEARGAEVMVVDRLASRLRMATDLGAGRTALVDNARAAIGEWTRGEGPVAVFEATGVPAVLEEAVELVAHSGSVIVVGLSSERVSIPMVEFTRKELSVLGSRNSSGEFRAALDLLRDQRRRVEQLITHRYTFDAASAAFRQAHEHPGDTEKVIIMMEAG
jgi:L-gulonate 5-dehydrogenase